MKVVVYCRNDDPYSQMLKNLLTMKNIPFENKEVTRDKVAFEEMYEVSGQTATPVLVINGRSYAGFDREMIKQVVEQELKQEHQESNDQAT